MGAPAKARHAADCRRLEHIPNVGPAMAADLRLIGIPLPQGLIGQDPLALFQRLCLQTGQRHDPCVLDTLMAAVDFMQGAAATPWWAYTAQRQALYGQQPPLPGLPG